MKTLKFKMVGVRPLIQHNGRLADPLDPYAQVLKRLTSIKVKTDEIHRQIGDAEWEGGLYYDAELGPVVKSDAIECLMVQAAKKVKKGPDAKAGIFAADELYKIDYEGPRDLPTLKDTPAYRLRVGVPVKGSRIMRTRPRFAGWSITGAIKFDETLFNADAIEDLLEVAGARVGLGDWRPKYGLFTVSFPGGEE